MKGTGKKPLVIAPVLLIAAGALALFVESKPPALPAPNETDPLPNEEPPLEE